MTLPSHLLPHSRAHSQQLGSCVESDAVCSWYELVGGMHSASSPWGIHDTAPSADHELDLRVLSGVALVTELTDGPIVACSRDRVRITVSANSVIASTRYRRGGCVRIVCAWPSSPSRAFASPSPCSQARAPALPPFASHFNVRHDGLADWVSPTPPSLRVHPLRPCARHVRRPRRWSSRGSTPRAALSPPLSPSPASTRRLMS